jgi:sugar/nucleoside kinase (ribokinase family)
MTTVGVVGGLSVDHLVTEGAGVRFNCLGGPALFAALGSHTVAGVEIRVCTVIPDDEPRFMEQLAAFSVDLTHCTSTTAASRLWILNSPQGRRIIATAAPYGLELADGQEQSNDATAEPTPSFFRGLDGLLLSSPASGLRPGLAPPVTAVDPHQAEAHNRGLEYWQEIAASATVLLPSRVQVASFHPDPETALALLLAATGCPVIARLDADGILVMEPGRTTAMQDPEVRVVDTTGAGDASAAAITAALARGEDLATAAAFGISAARLVLSDWGHLGLTAGIRLDEPFSSITITHKENKVV